MRAFPPWRDALGSPRRGKPAGERDLRDNACFPRTGAAERRGTRRRKDPDEPECGHWNSANISFQKAQALSLTWACPSGGAALSRRRREDSVGNATFTERAALAGRRRRSRMGPCQRRAPLASPPGKGLWRTRARLPRTEAFAPGERSAFREPADACGGRRRLSSEKQVCGEGPFP